MITASLSVSENQRLQELALYGALDTLPEDAFDRITRMAAQQLATPMALISINDGKRQWFKSRFGLTRMEMPQDWAFCSHTILEDDVMVVPDSTKDDRFRSNSLVTEDPRIRFYAGVALKTPGGVTVGTLSVLDHNPRPDLSEMQRQMLKDLAAFVMDALDLRRMARLIRTSDRERADLTEQVQVAYRAKSEFLTQMSHELRNPLNAMLGYTDLLLSEPYGELGDDRYRDYVKSVQVSGGHMLALLTDILDYARLKGSTAELLLESVDLYEVIRETAEILGNAASDKGLRLEIATSPVVGETAGIEADVVKVRQILINLVSNAIKFTPAGGTVSVHLDMLDDSLRLVVRDTGIGIAPDNMEKIMAPFGQLRQGRRSQEGFGLGLPITKGFVERHGGSMTIISKLGEGTEVQILLPKKQ